MPPLFADLVLSRPGAAARRPGLAIPASLVLHAIAGTLLVLVTLITRDALPAVQALPPPPLAPFVQLPPEGAGGPSRVRVRPPRAPQRPPAATAFIPDTPPPPADDLLDSSEGPPVGGVVAPPCLQGCDPGGVPGGDPTALAGVAAASPAPPPPLRTGGDIRPPQKVRHVAPIYPEIARVAHVQGAVVLDCTIGADGAVDDVKILYGPPLLQTAAAEAVRQWRYRPTLLNGVAIPVVMTVTVHFTLDPR